MKKITKMVLLSSVISLNADSLMEQARENNLIPIPKNVSELITSIDNPNNKLTKEKIELGKMLYFDPRLSKSGLISCNTCHNLSTGGDDNIPVATGHKWRANPHHLNSPTVYNAVFNDKQFWDGRSPDLEDQATGPIQAAPEMAMDAKTAVKLVKNIPEYKNMFNKAFPNEKITIKTIGKAIGAFERTLITPSRYDEYLHGNENALTKKEKEGLKTFIKVGCASCHNNIALGGSMQPFPIAKKYKYDNLGDFKGKNGLVKTPTLRNILETAPYFHNGSTYDIKEAIAIMGETQLGVTLSKKQIDSIATFFKSLTGEKPKITMPILPIQSKNIIKPDLN